MSEKKTKRILDKEMKRLLYLGILKEGFSAYSSLVMLIGRKMTQDKRVVTDFRHMNTRIAKNLAYPLVKDTFTTLGNSKCEVLSVLDLKDAFHSLRLSEKSKKCCGILPYFWQCILFVSENAHGTKCFLINLANLHKYNSQLLRE